MLSNYYKTAEQTIYFKLYSNVLMEEYYMIVSDGYYSYIVI